jgi:hypothetical protein
MRIKIIPIFPESGHAGKEIFEELVEDAGF